MGTHEIQMFAEGFSKIGEGLGAMFFLIGLSFVYWGPPRWGKKGFSFLELIIALMIIIIMTVTGIRWFDQVTSAYSNQPKIEVQKIVSESIESEKTWHEKGKWICIDLEWTMKHPFDETISSMLTKLVQTTEEISSLRISGYGSNRYFVYFTHLY